MRCGCCEINRQQDKEESGGQRESEGDRGQKGESEFGDIVKMQILIPGVSDEA